MNTIRSNLEDTIADPKIQDKYLSQPNDIVEIREGTV
jgi:hypothetical protein